jgi:DNA-binding beta-propeller fold protein YncE
MKKTFLISCFSVMCLALMSVDLPMDSAALYATDIEVMDDGSVLISNRNSRDVRHYDASGKMLRRWEFSDPVTSLTLDGDRLYVTGSHAEGFLSCINLSNGKQVYKTPLGMGATAATLSPDGSRLWVCNRYEATVSEVDARRGKVLRETAVLREPCAAVVSPDGRYLFVNNFLPAQRADVDYVAADVSVIDLAKFEKIKDIKLANGSNALRGINISPDGKYVWVSHNLGRFQVPTSQLQQGWMNTSAVSVIDARALEYVGPVLLDNPDRGAAGVWGIGVDDRHIVVAQSGTHDVSVIDKGALEARLESYADREKLAYDLYILRDIRTRVPLEGNGPRMVELKGGKAYMTTFFSDRINVVDLAAGELAGVIDYNPGRRETAVDTGERVFNDATYCYQNWQSCNGCHPGEARTDGMNWDLMNDGIGNPKNCKSLLLSHVTPPNMISGIRAEAELAVRAGFSFIQFSQLPEELAVNVDDYLKALAPLPSPRLVKGKLSKKAVAGRAVYEELGCDRCHDGAYYTDMAMHRIGEDVEFEAGWDTPALSEVWRTAPYLFDGRAATMEDVFREHRHGVDRELSDEELGELVEYVNSL